MNKTIYLRSEDEPVWAEARRLTSNKISPVIIEALREYVRRRKTERVAELKREIAELQVGKQF